MQCQIGLFFLKPLPKILSSTHAILNFMNKYRVTEETNFCGKCSGVNTYSDADESSQASSPVRFHFSHTN